MTGEVTTYAKAAAELLQAAAAHRDAQTTEMAQSYVEAQEVLDRQADVRTILGTETVGLVKRIYWLNKHRRIGRLMVGDPANLMEYSTEFRGNVIATPLLLPTASEHMDAASLRDGFQFTASKRGEYTGPSLHISRLLVDADTGDAREVDWWSVSVRQGRNDEVDRVAFDSQECKSERRDKRGAIVKDYLERYPNLKGYRLLLLDSGENPRIDDSHLDLTFECDPTMTWKRIAQAQKERGSNKPLVNELKDQLTRGIGWDYADDVYSFPLGLIMQARNELRARWSRK